MIRYARSAAFAAAALIVTSLTGATFLRADYNTERRIDMFNIHNSETISIVYKKDGQYIPEALDKLNWFMRDWRRNEATKMDPHTIDIVWEIHEELGSKQPIHFVSGYRSPKTNEALRHAGGGQAKFSQHIQGKAMDVAFPDTIVVSGADDILVPTHNSRILAKKIPSATLEILDDVAHGIPLMDERVVHRALGKLWNGAR